MESNNPESKREVKHESEDELKQDSEGELDHGSDREYESYGDPGIESKDGKVPAFLKWTYFILPIWGIFTFYFYWNGSVGWLDRGYWKQLQIAANTTFPIHNQSVPNDKNIQLAPAEQVKVEEDLE